MATIQLVENDTQPSLSMTYEGVDLTGASVELHIAYRPDALVKAATITDAAAGEAVFEWQPGDLRAGRWAAEIQVTDADGGVITFTGLVLDIAKEIA